jgi:hypothetical protein
MVIFKIKTEDTVKNYWVNYWIQFQRINFDICFKAKFKKIVKC